MYKLIILKKFIPPIIYNFFLKLFYLKKKYYGLNKLDKKLEKYLDFENGYFVELGANDGKTQSNTLYYEKYKKWKGALIEAAPPNFLKCLANRSSKTNIFCNACVSFDYKEKYVEIIYSNLMSIPTDLESDIKDPENHALIGKQFLPSKETNFKFGAIARTLNSILEEASAPKIIDFMSLDVEGAELEVLKGINYNDYQFRYMCIESRSIDKIENYLNNYDYKLIEKISTHDYIFKKNHIIQ